MSLRDTPNSHKILVPLVAGPAINRAYDPSSGGLPGEGPGRLSLPERWVTQPGVDPLCESDPETDRDLLLWLDTADTDTLELAPVVVDEETDRPFQRRVMRWRDKSGKNNDAVAVSEEMAPKLAKYQPFFPQSVDMSQVCLEPGTGEGGEGGDPPLLVCDPEVTIRVCGSEVIAPCGQWTDMYDYISPAEGDWRTGPGKIVVVSNYADILHSVPDNVTDYEDGVLWGAYCPAAASSALPGVDNFQDGGISAPYLTGIIYNGDPGRNGSVVVALAGWVQGSYSGGEEFQIWFKDAGGTIQNSPAMAGRHVRVTHKNQGTGITQVIGTGTVNSTGQVRWCSCEQPWFYWEQGFANPGTATFLIEIAAPGAEAWPWETDRTESYCGAGCGTTGNPNPVILIHP